jgi:hypothetical protein
VARGSVGSFLVFEAAVAGSVGELQAGRGAPGLVSALHREPIHCALSSSGATTPTTIRKWNIVPVHPERQYPVTHDFGQWVGRPCTWCDVRDRGAEQNTQSSDDKHFSASHLEVDLQ